MVARKAEGDAKLPRPPGAPAIGPLALRADLRRTLLSPVLEQPGEQHRLVADRYRRELVEAVEANVRIWRDEIEVPVNGGVHGGEDREEGQGMDGDSFARRSAQCDGPGKRGCLGLRL